MSNQTDKHKYDDIMNLPHHTSLAHPRMGMTDRAAQFSPFAALTGYGTVIKETARLTERRIELDEYEKAALDARLRLLREGPGDQPEVVITYFQPDAEKAGGAYLSVSGVIKKIDNFERCVVMMEGTKIPIDDIIAIEGEMFRFFENTTI